MVASSGCGAASCCLHQCNGPDFYILPVAIARCSGIVDKPADLDVAMVMGMGFPAFRGGLIFWADLVGAGALRTGVSCYCLCPTVMCFAPRVPCTACIPAQCMHLKPRFCPAHVQTTSASGWPAGQSSSAAQLCRASSNRLHIWSAVHARAPSCRQVKAQHPSFRAERPTSSGQQLIPSFQRSSGTAADQ